MRPKSIVATLIAVLMLSLSCAASACEMSCDLKVIGLGCHHAGLRVPAAQPHSEMRGCGMNSTVVTHIFGVTQNSLCTHAVCEQPQAASNEADVMHLVSVQQMVILSVLAFPTPLHSLALQPAETPPLRPPLLVSLQTIIRV
jgi:hypothetical protein